MSRGWGWLAFATLLWAATLAAALGLRPLLPVDETRYLSVAWEMWLRGDWLVPFRNGEPYSDKPPLLFWLINLGWLAFGVNEVSARLVAPLFALGAAFLTFALARRFWPDRASTRGYACVLLLTCGAFALHATLTLFDAMVAFFALLGWIGVAEARGGRTRRGWILVALAIGFGILAKGPVILLHVAPAALLAPWWTGRETRPESWPRWYLGFGLAALGGAAIALAWAIPAAIAGGEAYARAIFIGQHAGRAVASFQHARPFWFYAPALLVALLPMALWLAPWRLARATPGLLADPGIRFCAFVLAAAFALFSAISGKQIHYLLPEIALVAIVAGRLVDQDGFVDRALDVALPGLALIVGGLALAAMPLAIEFLARGRPGLGPTVALIVIQYVAGLAMIGFGAWLLAGRARPAPARVASLGVATATLIVGAHLGFVALAPAYDPDLPGEHISRQQRLGGEVGWVGDYEAEFNFVGRLRQPVVELVDRDPVLWVLEKPKRVLVVTYSGRGQLPGEWPQPIYVGAWRGRILAVWPAELFERYGPLLLTGER